MPPSPSRKSLLAVAAWNERKAAHAQKRGDTVAAARMRATAKRLREAK